MKNIVITIAIIGILTLGLFSIRANRANAGEMEAEGHAYATVKHRQNCTEFSATTFLTTPFDPTQSAPVHLGTSTLIYKCAYELPVSIHLSLANGVYDGNKGHLLLHKSNNNEHTTIEYVVCADLLGGSGSNALNFGDGKADCPRQLSIKNFDFLADDYDGVGEGEYDGANDVLIQVMLFTIHDQMVEEGDYTDNITATLEF